MTTLRIGLIGAGANTRLRHIPGFLALDDVELVCVANQTIESGEQVADENDIPRVYAHWRDVVADPDVDAVCIGTWPYLHAAATCAALVAGKHVLCEARMALNVFDARKMLATANETDRVAMLVPSPFGLKGDRYVRQLLAEGYLGHIREIGVRALTSTYLDGGTPLAWRQIERLSGVNVLTLGILNETVQRWFGRAESVVAQTALFVPRRLDPETEQMADVDIPDSVTVLARQASGAQCVYHVSGHAWHGGAMRIEAYGSAGTLIYDLENDTIQGAGVGDLELEPLEIPADLVGGWQVESDFVAAIRQGNPVTHTNFTDGLKYMCFTEAVRRSADTGRRVWLSEL